MEKITLTNMFNFQNVEIIKKDIEEIQVQEHGTTKITMNDGVIHHVIESPSRVNQLILRTGEAND